MVDEDLGVVGPPPGLDVVVVEPAVVRRHEVTPLHDPQLPGQLPAAVLRNGGDGLLDACAAVYEHDRAQTCFAEEVAPCELVHVRSDGNAGLVVVHSLPPSYGTVNLPTFEARASTERTTGEPGDEAVEERVVEQGQRDARDQRGGHERA